jgi:hypothetical protein
VVVVAQISCTRSFAMYYKKHWIYHIDMYTKNICEVKVK